MDISRAAKLPAVLATLRAEGRENILIVPASFCADAGWLLSPDFRSNTDLLELRYQWK
ncbi:MAG: hypothetical protein IH987_20195, partial [Planctomycetes bacterium]|nr:hypothetical protein [Planctomycetota bacterium]